MKTTYINPNIMNKIILFLFLFAGIANAQIVNIPDTNFKAKLFALGVDTNTDGNIQVSEALVITTLQVNNSNILDLTGIEAFTNLAQLNCNGNQFTELNLTTLTNLNNLECGSESLINLFLKNGKTEAVVLANSPNLAFICADDNQFSSIQNQLNTLGMTNTVVSSYCSFTPGGNYNTITGTIKYDDENNGCDAGDFAQSYAKIKIFDGTNSGSSFINNLGNYSFYTQTGEFIITPEVQNPSYFTISTVNATINFPAVDNSIQTQNFCITANGIHPDLEIILTPIGVARPGFDATYKLIYKNKGNQSQTGSINLSFDDSKTDFIAASPTVANQGLNSLIWFYSDLQPFETREINFTLNINSPLETPPVNVDDVLSFTASINFVAGDETPSDNFFNLNQIVVNALDPNNKICLEGKALLPERIGDYLHYNINFENIGTSEAVNVVVKDMIDLSKYDINSLQLLYASDELETKIDNDKVEFIFENINLAPSNGNPVGGHGNVLFKIRTLPTLPVGSEVINTANIYFDYNGPIVTNEAKTTFSSLSNAIFIKDKSITIFPNPTTSKINITSNFSIKSIAIYDVQGRILQSIIEDSKTSNLDISDKPNGVYFLKITTDKGSKIEKVVKE